MKKVAIAILAFLYISTSIGATIHLHYCMGDLVNWNLQHDPGDKCSYCGMKLDHKPQNNGCCKDEYKQIKNKKDQKLSQTCVIQPVCIVSLTFQSELSAPLTAIKETNPVSNAPPRSRLALYIRHCIFLI